MPKIIKRIRNFGYRIPGLRRRFQLEDLLLVGVAVGGSFEQAYLRMELVEHQAKIAMNAKAIGDVRRLPQSEIEALSKKGRPASSPMREQTDDRSSSPSAGAVAHQRPDVDRAFRLVALGQQAAVPVGEPVGRAQHACGPAGALELRSCDFPNSASTLLQT